LQPKQNKESTGQKSIEWASGIFEGEGCIHYEQRYDRWVIEVEMTDGDVMWDLYFALGCRGNIEKMRKRPSRPEHYKATQKWRTSKRDLIFNILKEMYPYLGNRRREKAMQFFSWYQNKTK
jgi:hypothetical protein